MNKPSRTYSRIESRVSTSLALGREHVAALDARADKQGITRSGVLRSILDDVLADEIEIPESKYFPDLNCSEQTQGFINPETSIRKFAP